MATVDPIKQCEDYLELFRVKDNEYLLGVFQNGITFYKQQVRAINIFYALEQTNVLKKPGKTTLQKDRMRIGIIGGGIGGMTFAAVALKTGFKVTLIEEKRMLLHMQHGCDTRKIHPNVYDWPEKDKDSLSPYAKLPVLSWKNDTASRVADQLRMQFTRLHEEINNGHAGKSEIYLSAKIYRIKNSGKEIQVAIKLEDTPGYTLCDFDILIYSPGYGVEKGTINSINSLPKTPSYWRNDDYSQPLVSKDEKKFVIWGVGDGALIDMFRLKITDFDLDNFLKCLSEDKKNFSILTNFFIRLKERWENLKNKNEEGWLWKEFEKLNEKHYQSVVKNYILPNWVKNKKVTIVGNADFFEDNLSLNKTSLLNCFISYIIFKKIDAAIEYCPLSKSKQKIKMAKIERSIVRYGTNREQNLKDLKIASKTVSTLKKLQRDSSIYDNGVQIWKYSEITDLFTAAVTKKNIEYFRAETVGICSNFISVLSKVLQSVTSGYQKKNNFRIALHRIIDVEGLLHYQQITSYFQGLTSDSVKTRSVGSAYKLNRGNVGYSIATGKSLLVKKPSNNKKFIQLLNALNLDEDFDIGNRRSFLSMPILAVAGKKEFSTNLILYIDSEDVSFFDNPKIIHVIYSSLLGFLESIKRLISFNHISMSSLNFEPQIIGKSSAINKDFEGFWVDLSRKYQFLNPTKSELKMDSFHTFDVLYGSQN